MSIVKRIKQYIDYKGITIQKFEQDIGYSNGAFGSQLRNNKSIGSDKIEKILSTYNDININWLLTGNGSMIKNTHYSSLSGHDPPENIVSEPQAEYQLLIQTQQELVQTQKKLIEQLEENLKHYQQDEKPKNKNKKAS